MKRRACLSSARNQHKQNSSNFNGNQSNKDCENSKGSKTTQEIFTENKRLSFCLLGVSEDGGPTWLRGGKIVARIFFFFFFLHDKSNLVSLFLHYLGMRPSLNWHLLLDFWQKTKVGLHIKNLDLHITNNRIIIFSTWLHGLRREKHDKIMTFRQWITSISGFATL